VALTSAALVAPPALRIIVLTMASLKPGRGAFDVLAVGLFLGFLAILPPDAPSLLPIQGEGKIKAIGKSQALLERELARPTG
jgi:hypothetical protein